MTLVLCQLLYMDYLIETSQQPCEIDTGYKLVTGKDLFQSYITSKGK